jgi:hypothetical protein
MDKKEKFLSDIEIVERLKNHVVNLVYAPVGSGKTTWVNEQLVNTVKDKREILYLIDTTAGRDQIINNNNDVSTEYSEAWEMWMNTRGNVAFGEIPDLPPDKMPVMTFSKLAWIIKKGGLGYGNLKHIILDERQNLKIFQSYGEHHDENVLKYAENWIKRVYTETDITITALSATPRKILTMFPEEKMHHVLTEAEKGSLRTLKHGVKNQYVSLHNIITSIPDGRTVIYVPHIRNMKKYCKLIQAVTNKNIQMIWSRNNDQHEMNDVQNGIWDSILKESKIPDGIDILIYNASCLTGININTPIDNVIVHDPDEDNQIQARGRIRRDIKRLYTLGGNYITLPNNYIGKPLYKEDKDELAIATNIVVDGHLKKFTTIKKYIEQSTEYELTQKRNRTNGQDLTYHIINHKNQTTT